MKSPERRGAVEALVLVALLWLAYKFQKRREERRIASYEARFGRPVACAISEGRVCVGMPREAVQAALGMPASSRSHRSSRGTRETLRYGKRADRSYDLFVYLKNGVVDGWAIER